ncbi:MAG: hypothetical protein PHZ14_11145 [Sulfuricella sp.]|nr:hypothetical protein [Sulfuricella sp.]
MTNEWTWDLPPGQAALACPPLHFERFKEPEARAEKVLGYDDKGEVCFYRHAYSLTENFLDEEGLPCESEVFYETVTAWRLADRRWLTCLRQGGEQGVCNDRHRPPSYAMADQRPR